MLPPKRAPDPNWLVSLMFGAIYRAAGLIRAMGELQPDADRGRCTVHRLRNILVDLPKRPRLHDRGRTAPWAELERATTPTHGGRKLVLDGDWRPGHR